MTTGLSVLIVDDEQLARVRLAILLQELSAEFPLATLGEAADAAQALSWLAAHDGCDLVLLDIQMPGLRRHRAGDAAQSGAACRSARRRWCS